MPASQPINISVSVKIDFEQLKALSPSQLSALFSGLAQVAAANNLPMKASKP